MKGPSFWEELKRRNVLRVGAFYAGAAWLLVQVATQVLPFFDVPNGVVRWVVVAAIIGFPLVLALSWFYELTPQGLRLESELAADGAIPRNSGRGLDRWIIALLMLAVAVLLAKLFVDGRKPAAPSGNGDRSIAVLPFESLSDDKSNAYFAQGIQDEILTRLSKIGALRVISRTSTQRYASSPDNLPEIAKKLGVDQVLEGSVQKSGDTVRINVQLIRAATDEHLWAEIYDRKLDNVFGVEGEVAQAIAEALNARLTGDEHAAVALAPTRNPVAYDAYLRGLNAELSFAGPQSYFEAERLYAEAVKADASFALAWAHLAMVRSYIYLNGLNHTDAFLAQLKSSADTAMQLQPQLGEAWLARGYYFYRGLKDYDAAIAAFEQARLRLPGSGEVPAAIAYAQRRQGRWESALANLQAAAQRDPQNISYALGVAEICAATRHYAQAQAALDRAAESSPDSLAIRNQKISTFQSAGDLDAAQRVIDALPSGPESWGSRIQQLLLRRDYRALVALTQSMLDSQDSTLGDHVVEVYLLLGAGHLLLGETNAAHAVLERGRQRALELRASGVDTAEIAGSLAAIEAALGEPQAALREADRGIELTGNDQWERPGAELRRTQVLALNGDNEGVFAALPHLLEVANGLDVGGLRYDPIWDRVRGDPRFAALLEQAQARVTP